MLHAFLLYTWNVCISKVAIFQLQYHIISLVRAYWWCVDFHEKSCNAFIFQAFAKMFNTTPDDLDMHVIYDVSHNIAKVEEHFIEGKQKTLLVHRKGSTRAFPPHHPLIPVDYQVSFGNQVWIFYGKTLKYNANKPVWAQQLDAHLVMHALWPWRWRGWADAETYRLAWYNATILSWAFSILNLKPKSL